ncbi:MAG TPA: ABC transporter permease [Vicinamibacteria bacterium]|nr:ABC transporter permease [Vicinamibacteria bacterium]
MREVRLALRSLAKAPLFTGVAVLSLALGMGANTAMFSLVDQILLRLLPVENPRELVQLKIEGGRFGSNAGDGTGTFSHPLYLALRDRNTVFSGLTGQMVTRASLLGPDRNEMVSVGLVAGNFFDVLGVRPQHGRLLRPDDDRVRNAHPVAVLQHDFWRNRFAGDTAVVGSAVRLNGSPFTVIGVAAAGFEGTDSGIPTNLWVPVTMKPTITPTWDELDNERYAWFYLFGRLRPGVSLEQAQAAMRVLYRQRQDEELQGQYFRQYPDLEARFLRQVFSLVPAARGQSDLRLRFEQPLVVLQWLVGFVLLIACANVANLLLARAAARQREIAIRTALGARRGQIVLQLLLESLILAVAGGLAGLVLSVVLARALLRFLPFDAANLSLVTTPDLRILLFTGALIVATAVLFGLVPALQGSSVSPGLTLKAEAGSVAGGHGHVRLRKALVALQVGLATVLLIGAGLFVRTLQELRRVDLGFRTENVVTMGVRPATVYDEARKRHVFRALIEGLAAVPGVKAVGANSTRLLVGGRWDSGLTIPGLTLPDGRHPWSYFNAVTPGYFEALGIPITSGRDFTWNDWGTTEQRCLVNEALVSEYMKGENPVGRRIAQGREVAPNMEVIGVFGNASYDNVRGAVPRQTFVSMGGGDRLRHIGGIVVYARTDRDPRQVMPALRQAVGRIDPDLVVWEMRTLDAQLDMRLANERMLSFLATGFAVLATLLAVVGLYGVLAFVVTRRTREIGIRMALGAERRNVIRLVLGEMVALFVFGVAAGVFAGTAGGRYVESQLFGVHASDPAVFALSAGALLAAALAAGLVPAWRAAKIDPIRALRYE